MKTRLIILNIVSYIILNFIIIDAIIYNTKPYSSAYGRLKGVNEGVMIFDIKDFYPLFSVLGVNLLISTVFFYVIYKWYLKENIFKTFFKLIISFALINLILFLIVYITQDMYMYLFYIAYILFPSSIMILLMLPLFWLNKKLIEKKRHLEQ